MPETEPGLHGEPLASGPENAGTTEHAAKKGTGTPGAPSVVGLHDVAPIESRVDDEDERAAHKQVIDGGGAGAND